jgi:hypothetical protein
MKVHNVVVFLLVLFTISCEQHSIFYTITTETEPRDPRIEGSPTNMVVGKYSGESGPVSILYVASGKLHWYAKNESGEPEWDSETYEIPQPEGDGRIISLAATPSRLYALRQNDNNTLDATLHYIEQASIGKDDAEWKKIENAADGYVLLIIYTDPETEQLFAGARKNDTIGRTYAILYLDTDELKIFKEETGILSGTAYREDAYYLSTISVSTINGTKGGIFQIAETDLAANNVDSLIQLDDTAAVEEEKDLNNHRMFMSMIKLENEAIIAVERDGGALYEVKSGSFARMRYTTGEDNSDWITTGRYATGALALWEKHNDPNNKLLIAGIQGALYTSSNSSYTHGYVEFKLKSDGSLDTTSGRMEPNLSVDTNTDRYTATIGKHPINHLFQVPKDIDPNMTFFASTQTAGLWSYKDRFDGAGPQWNAEE